MLHTAPISAATNRLWLPRTALSSCMRGVMSRNTVGIELTDAQRFNYFPASPLCVINWWFQGSSELLPSGAPTRLDSSIPRTPLSGVMFSGPQTQPCVSWCPGPVHGMMLIFMPDALHQLTGIDVTQTVNRFIDVRGLFPTPWVDLCNAVAAAADDDQRVTLIQDFLEPQWNAARPKQPMQAHRVQDWAHALALRAATSGAGRSLRQVERRIKQWAGQPLRELRGMGRAETAFFEGVAAAEQGQRPNWAAVAESSGYADQSHLCRETRRVTGFAPQELYWRIAQDEGFWSYRLWA